MFPVHSAFKEAGTNHIPSTGLTFAVEGYNQGRINYHDSAYLLSTDLDAPATQLIQTYFDRWQIEVNQHDQKDLWV